MKMNSSIALARKFLATKLGLAFIIAVVGFAVVLSPNAGFAQSSGGKKVIRLEAIKVEGRIQKPQAFYILQRSNLNFEGLELKQTFLQKITDSINKKPF